MYFLTDAVWKRKVSFFLQSTFEFSLVIRTSLSRKREKEEEEEKK